ncbi:MAG TPA: response regulator [Thermoanaerobaculia bacterium]|jgi:DNA-binding NarL/FixJ family response regulator|nr:response regulator [Thermoanaerobaculia bacterium]
MRLLIVDDEPNVLFAISSYLWGTNWLVDCASELEEAQALLANVTYDVVITDVRLSEVQQAEGLHVISFVRDRAIDVPLVVLTAFETEEIRREVERLGVNALLCKPQPLELIVRLIDELAAARIVA